MAYDISVPFSFTKNGIYYFERRVPTDLSKHYDTRKISYSLRTRSVRVAATRARRAADQLDEYWYHLRCKDADLPGQHRLRIAAGGTEATPGVSLSDAVLLSEAVAIYPVTPREWFLVPLFAIDEAVERIRDGSIKGVSYDPERALLT